MRFRLYGGNLRVHGCSAHPQGCDFFDHALEWMIGSREEAKAQLLVYRRSVVARITSLTTILASIDAMLTRLDLLGVGVIT